MFPAERFVTMCPRASERRSQPLVQLQILRRCAKDADLRPELWKSHTWGVIEPQKHGLNESLDTVVKSFCMAYRIPVFLDEIRYPWLYRHCQKFRVHKDGRKNGSERQRPSIVLDELAVPSGLLARIKENRQSVVQVPAVSYSRQNSIERPASFRKAIIRSVMLGHTHIHNMT